MLLLRQDEVHISSCNRRRKETDEDCRPGLREFLKGIAEMYEMHVYTMGTRAYAVEVCKIIDPDGGLFGGRILSRDESGSESHSFLDSDQDAEGGLAGMTRKSLQRLFPCDTSMVVIIDDRADVWDGSPNLVKVIPCTSSPPAPPAPLTRRRLR